PWAATVASSPPWTGSTSRVPTPSPCTHRPARWLSRLSLMARSRDHFLWVCPSGRVTMWLQPALLAQYSHARQVSVEYGLYPRLRAALSPCRRYFVPPPRCFACRSPRAVAGQQPVL